MGKITVDLDFTEDLMFKTLLLGTMEFQSQLLPLIEVGACKSSVD